MVQDRTYAKQKLREIENLADSEELPILTLQVREMLLPMTALPSRATGSGPTPIEASAMSGTDGAQTRNYKFGARSW